MRKPGRLTGIAAAMILLATACLCMAEDQPGTKIEKIVVKAGQDAARNPGQVLDLQIEVLGPVERGILGGKGQHVPVPNHPVVFSVMDPEKTGAKIIGDGSAITDAGGKARCKVEVGHKFGDQYFKAKATDSEGNTQTAIIRLVAGVTISGQDQEGAAGSYLDKPLSLTVNGEDGQPAKDVRVFFRVEGGPRNGTVDDDHVFTDGEGKASTKLKLPKHTGKVNVVAEIAGPSYFARGIRFTATSVNKMAIMLTLAGGLALFIFGMKHMSEGLQRVAGEKMKIILKMFTRNRFIAIVTGAIVAGSIQSSSACTVMTVGFVNAGLISLRQAIGVVFGANIGTTVTGQIISFRLTDVAFPAIAAGLLITMIVRNRSNKAYGDALMGFGMLFLGIMLMGETLRPLGESPSFKALFQSFDCKPVNGVMPIGNVLCSLMIGTMVTILIQSSSATVGLTMALAGSGLLNFWTAVPIILGDNIGTTTTALLASIGTNRAARRTALAHSLFNVCGATYMLILFYVPAPWSDSGRPFFIELVNYATRGDVFADIPENIERHIANAHSLFNVVNVLMFIPLVGVLERLCTFLIPREQEDEQPSYLEPRLLNQPSIALDQAIKELGYMSSLSFKSISDAFHSMRTFDPRLEQKLNRREDMIDKLQGDITEYISKLSQRVLNEEQSRMLAPLMHAVNDAERIGDHAENLFELAQLRNSKKLEFSESAFVELEEMFAAVSEQFNDVLQAIEKHDPSSATKALKLEELINQFDHDLHTNHVDRLEAGSCNCQAGVIFLDMVANLEKVGDHLTNIAERMKLVMELAEENA